MSKNWQSTAKSILAFMVVAGWLVCVYCKCGFYFETNDDRLITEILSGVAALPADGRAVYVHYLLAAPLAALYRHFPGFPWYGFFLVVMYGVAYGILLSSLLRRSEKLGAYLAAGITMILFFLCTLQMLSILQFTSTAAFMAVCGYTYLLMESGNSRKKYILFTLLELFAFLIREEAMLMIQPVGILAWCGLELVGGKVCLKQNLKKGLTVILPLIFVVGGGILVDKIIYGASEWKEYMAFTEAEEALFDFYGKTDYREVRKILDRYGVTETEYTAYTQYVILDYDVSAECAQELAAYARENNARSNNCAEILYRIAEKRFRADYHGINTLSTLLWGTMLIWIVTQKSYHLIWPVLGVGISETAIWYFMIWRGRTPWRVAVPLFICDIFILAALIWRDLCEKDIRGKWRYVLLVGLSVIMLRYTYLMGQTQYRYCVRENRNNEILVQSMYEIEDYCRANPDKKYLLGANSMSYFRGSALDTRMTLPRNSIVTGNWFSNSPPARRHLKDYLGENDGSIYLIVYAETPIDFAALDYLEEKTKCAPIETDSFTTTSGAVYTVYCFGEEE